MLVNTLRTLVTQSVPVLVLPTVPPANQPIPIQAPVNPSIPVPTPPLLSPIAPPSDAVRGQSTYLGTIVALPECVVMSRDGSLDIGNPTLENVIRIRWHWNGSFDAERRKGEDEVEPIQHRGHCLGAPASSWHRLV